MAEAKGTSPLLRLLRQGGVYALGNMAIKASGLLLAPLYLNEALFAQVSFGHLVMLEATAQLLIPVVGLGLIAGMLKFMADPALGDDARAVPLMTLLPTVIAGAVFILITWPLAGRIASVVLGDSASANVIRTLVLYIALKVIGMVPMTLIRVRERAVLYVAAMLAETVVLIGGVYYALAVAGAGLDGVINAYAFSAGASALILTAGMLVLVEWRVQWELSRRLIRFGAPLAAAGIALPILHVGDRYLMEWLSTTEELAIYGWAARLSSVLNMLVVQSFQLAFAVIGIKELGHGEAGAALHRRAFRHYSVWAGWIALGLAILTRDVTALLSSSESYLLAGPMVLPLATGFVLYGLFVISTNVFYAHGETRIVAVGVFAAAILNIALNVALIPLWGGIGAAVATFVAYGALGIVTLRISERYIRIRFDLSIIITVLAVVYAFWFIGTLAWAWPLVPRIGLFALLIVLYPVVITLTGVYPWEDVRGLIGDIRRWLHRAPARAPEDAGEAPPSG